MSNAKNKSVMYLRGMDQKTVREAKAKAAREGLTLAAFVERALRRETRASRPVPDRLTEIAQDMDWYERNKPALLQRHEGQYLAIVDRQVVDHDPDAEALATRIADRYGHRSVYMPLCQSVPRVVNVRSPRVAR